MNSVDLRTGFLCTGFLGTGFSRTGFLRRGLNAFGLNAFALVFALAFALAVFAGFASALTYIDSCQTLNVSDVYELNASISAGAGVCLTINASNVTLECGSYNIDGPGLSSDATAVLITSNGDNALVQNCTIVNFRNGIISDGANNVVIKVNKLLTHLSDVNPVACNFTQSDSHGILVKDSLNSQVSGNTVDAHFCSGIESFNSNSTLIEYNTVTGNLKFGIRVAGSEINCSWWYNWPGYPLQCREWRPADSYSTGNIVRGNTVYENGFNGSTPVNHSAEIYVQNSNDAVIENNKVWSNHSQTCADNQFWCDYFDIGCEYACGIQMVCTSNTQALNNVVTGTEKGIAFPNTHHYNVWNSSASSCGGISQNNNVIRGNTINDVKGTGIETFYGNYSMIDANTIENPAGSGVWFSGGYGTVSNNVIRNASAIHENVARAGLTLTRAYFTTITGNQISDSNMHGILFSQDNDDNVVNNNSITGSKYAGIILGMHQCPVATHGNCVVERNTFTGNTIGNNALAGGYILYAKNANIVNFIYDQSWFDGVTRVSGGQENRFIDNTIISTPGTPDLSSGGSSSIYFINTPVNRVTNEFMSLNESNVTVSWYLDVHVQDLNGSAVNAAQVTITDAFGNTVFSGATDASGNIPRQTLQEYYEAGFNNTVTNSTNNTPYTVRVTNGCAQASATTQLTASQAMTLTLDLSPPIISNVHVIDVTQNTVLLGWNTDESTNESIDYGTSASYGSVFTNAAFATSHSVLLTGLSSGTQYHYRINACDAQCNCAQSADYAFTTIGGGTTGGGGGGETLPTPTLTVTTTPTVSPTGGASPSPTVAPTIAGTITASPTVAPTIAGTITASPTPTLSAGTGLVTASGFDYGLWGGIALLLILLALSAYLLVRGKKKKD